ncbi:MAG: hypothetical protein OEY01_03425 [Desulfobulbaceae bacterium]|nr:hypothetical protein [Desulfobulbaceae bacterium]
MKLKQYHLLKTYLESSILSLSAHIALINYQMENTPQQTRLLKKVRKKLKKERKILREQLSALVDSQRLQVITQGLQSYEAYRNLKRKEQ